MKNNLIKHFLLDSSNLNDITFVQQNHNVSMFKLFIYEKEPYCVTTNEINSRIFPYESKYLKDL